MTCCFKAVATSLASLVLAGLLFSELKIIFIKIALYEQMTIIYDF